MKSIAVSSYCTVNDDVKCGSFSESESTQSARSSGERRDAEESTDPKILSFSHDSEWTRGREENISVSLLFCSVTTALHKHYQGRSSLYDKRV